MTVSCEFGGIVPIDPDVANPQDGCAPISTSVVHLRDGRCPRGCAQECSGHSVCVPHLKQFLEQDEVLHEVGG
jgi:hypothetical protein